MDDYYVYLHRRMSDDKVFYVGKGRGRRAYRGDKSSRSSKWLNMANKYGWYVELVFDSLSEEEAYELEVNTILEMQYFNEPLVNHNSGGYGGRPAELTKSFREKVSEGLKRYYSTHESHHKGKQGFKFWENGRSNHLAWENLDTIYLYYVAGLRYSTLTRVFPDISKTVFRKVCEYFEAVGDPMQDENWLSYIKGRDRVGLREQPLHGVNKATCYKVIKNISEFDRYIKEGFGEKAISRKMNIPLPSLKNMFKKIRNGYDYTTDPVMTVIQNRLKVLANAEMLDEDDND